MNHIVLNCTTHLCGESIYVGPQQTGTAAKSVNIYCPKCGKFIISMENPFYMEAEPTLVRNIGGRSLGQMQLPENVAWLISINDHVAYPLKLGKQSIGRESQDRKSNISLNAGDLHMSSLHCSINCELDRNGVPQFMLVDEHSKNGTWINDKKIEHPEARYLKNLDRMRLGKSRFLFVHHSYFEDGQNVSDWLNKNGGDQL